MKTTILIFLILILSGFTFGTDLFLPAMKSKGKTRIPIVATKVEGTKCDAFQFHVHFESTVMPVGAHFGCSTPLPTFHIECNVVNNTLLVASYGVLPIEVDGVIAEVVFSGQGGSLLEFSDAFMFNSEGKIPLQTHNGYLWIY